MSRIICIDANIVVYWLNGADQPQIARRIQSALDENREFIAPNLMRYEVTNVL